MKYTPDVLWGDGGEWDCTAAEWGILEYLSWLYSSSPVRDTVLVNDRLGSDMMSKHGDLLTSEYSDLMDHISSYTVPAASGFLGAGQPSRPDGRLLVWEESRGMGRSYGYNRVGTYCTVMCDVPDEYKTAAEIVAIMIKVVAQGGNFLLNVGPSSDGRIPELMQSRLISIGDWMSRNGECIYDSVPWIGSRFNSNKDIYFTAVEQRGLYIIVHGWHDDALTVNITNEMAELLDDIVLLGYNAKIVYEVPGKNKKQPEVITTTKHITIAVPEHTETIRQPTYYCSKCRTRRAPMMTPHQLQTKATQYDINDCIVRKRVKDPEHSITSDDIEDNKEKNAGYIRRRRPRHSRYDAESDKSEFNTPKHLDTRSDSETSDVHAPQLLADVVSDCFEHFELVPPAAVTRPRSSSAPVSRAQSHAPFMVCPTCSCDKWLLMPGDAVSDKSIIKRQEADYDETEHIMSHAYAADIPKKLDDVSMLRKTRAKHAVPMQRQAAVVHKSAGTHTVAIPVPTRPHSSKVMAAKSPQKQLPVREQPRPDVVPILIQFPKVSIGTLSDLLCSSLGIYVFHVTFTNRHIQPVLSMHGLEVSDRMSTV